MSTSFDISSSEPIFAVADVVARCASIATSSGLKTNGSGATRPYMPARLRGNVQLMFSKQPPLADALRGNEHFFRVQNIGACTTITNRSVRRSFMTSNKPWGLAEYVIRDLDGYELSFAGGEIYERPKTATESLPAHIKIELRHRCQLTMRECSWLGQLGR